MSNYKARKRAMRWMASKGGLATADAWWEWYRGLSEGELTGVCRTAIVSRLFDKIRVDARCNTTESRREVRRLVRVYYLVSVGLVQQRGQSVKAWLSGGYRDETTTPDAGCTVLSLAIHMARNERDTKRNDHAAHCSHYYWNRFRRACNIWVWHQQSKRSKNSSISGDAGMVGIRSRVAEAAGLR